MKYTATIKKYRTADNDWVSSIIVMGNEKTIGHIITRSEQSMPDDKLLEFARLIVSNIEARGVEDAS